MAAALPPALARLVQALTRLPGVGEKTATRMALQVLRWPRAQARELARAVGELHDRIRLCSRCQTFSESDPCPVCADPRRDTTRLCVVEDPGDLLAVEKAGAFRGRYHVLHGVLAPMDGVGPDQLKIRELLERVRAEGVREVILATSPTVAGEATAGYIADLLREMGVEATRIACGIPMGMDIKYADRQTLQKALEARRRA
ncbi:recombination protein RecR [Dissulfurirhabdus thermomarina]|uniref:Recombination protein RecR n=1 Tax=Dissulfurirhabdus thermomarina TaxID=1765737 RepID=A0A6N9TQS5_DISTH|nr:recombination mediator RecR [Dissulfurirhabdus thermomarina]NDY41797.1 recombination protein RecR [Dissulfurirhabdus thermomarina]NMX24062.1 recombination protein RecR [Dissulfurirhabdus thermomarina]